MMIFRSSAFLPNLISNFKTWPWSQICQEKSSQSHKFTRVALEFKTIAYTKRSTEYSGDTEDMFFQNMLRLSCLKYFVFFKIMFNVSEKEWILIPRWLSFRIQVWNAGVSVSYAYCISTLAITLALNNDRPECKDSIRPSKP